MKTFFSDVDNTLIFSHRKKFSYDKVLVEYFKGREQSYMTLDLYNYLKSQEEFHLLPITTRSKEQYRRIFIFSQELKCKYALVCNGGIMLVDGRVDEKWRKESLFLSYKQNYEVKRLYEYVNKNFNPKRTVFVDEFMFYSVFQENIDEVFSLLCKIADQNKVFVERDTRKIYVIANAISKDVAVERFRNRKNIDIEDYIVAGDSGFDISMLKKSKKSIASRELVKKLDNNYTIFGEREVLAFELAELLKKIKE